MRSSYRAYFIFLLIGFIGAISLSSVSAASWQLVQISEPEVHHTWDIIQVVETEPRADVEWEIIQGFEGHTNGFSQLTFNVVNVVWLIVFFLPVMILGIKMGPLGFIGGMSIMSIVFIFTIDDFMIPGTLNMVGIIIYLYKGGGY
jgi:hypothetical protein